MTRWRVAAAVGALAFAGVAVVYGVPDLSPAQTGAIPTTRPVLGDVDVRIHTLGELGPRQSMSLAAPSIGGMLQIVKLASSGSVVHKGEVLLEFDRAEQEYNLQQAESELAEAEQEIVKLEADARVEATQDQLNLLHARHELRRAEIAVSGNEFVGKIEAEKNTLKLEQARRALTQLDADVRTHADSSRSARAVLEEKRSKARIAADFARRNIDSMTLAAPLDGLVVVKDNVDASGGFGFPGMSLPEYRQGDTVQPGRTVLDVVDISEMEIKAKVAETDRPLVGSGAQAKVVVDALPTRSLSGSSNGVGGMASNAFWEPQTVRQFSATFALQRPSDILRPGMTAQVVIEGEKLSNVTHLPRQVLFEKEGHPVVYVRDGSTFVPVAVKVVRLTENRVVLRDFPPDAEVALVNPETAAAGTASAAGPSALPGSAQ